MSLATATTLGGQTAAQDEDHRRRLHARLREQLERLLLREEWEGARRAMGRTSVILGGNLK